MIDDTVKKDNIAIIKNIPILYSDKPGRNMNVYPEEEIISAIDYFNRASDLDKTYRYIYIRHTNDEIGEKETLQLVAGWIDNLYYDKNTKTLYSDIKLLPTTWGKLVKWLVKHNYPVGTSIRGSGIPVDTYMDWNGDKVRVIVRKNFKLKGFDFVVEPSFITTQVAGEEYITEQTNIKERFLEQIISEECLNEKEICELDEFCSKCNMKITESTKNDLSLNKGGLTMENLEKERLLIEVEKLQLEKTKLEDTILVLKKELEQLSQEKTAKQEQITTEQEQIEKLKTELKSILLLKEDLDKEIKALSAQIESSKQDLENTHKEKESLENAVKVLEQTVDEKKVVVRKYGKIFNEENPPKVRIVEPEERVLSTDWSKVDKDNLRKIAYLVWKGGNKDIVKAFGLLDDDWEKDWTQWKYPVCQFVKSEEPDYDLDCVLNINGLKTAYSFIVGRPGMALSYEKKKESAKNFLEWYKKAVDAGRIEDIPEVLVKLAEGTLVQTKDETINAILETLQINGYIDIEIPEGVREQSGEEFDLIKPDDLYVNLARATADAILGKIYIVNEELEEIVEQTINRTDEIDLEQEFARFFNIVISSTGFESREEAEDYIRQVINEASISDLLLSLKPLISAVVGALAQEGIEPDKAVNYAMNIFSLLANRYEKTNENKDIPKKQEDENLSNGQQEEHQPIVDNQEFQSQTKEETEESSLYEQVDDDKNLYLSKKEELEMEKLKSIIALVNDHYDVDITVDNITDVLAQIFESHIEFVEKVSELEAKIESMKVKIEETKQAGQEKVQEQFERKGTVKSKKEDKVDDDSFTKLMKNI